MLTRTLEAHATFGAKNNAISTVTPGHNDGTSSFARSWSLIIKCFVLVTLFAGVTPILPVSAQSESDSLEIKLQQATGSDRLPILAELTQALSLDQSARAIAYGWEARAIAADNTAPTIERRFRYWMGRAHLAISQHDSAYAHATELIQWATDVSDKEGVAMGAYLKGQALWQLASFDDAKSAYQNAIEGFEALGLGRNVANVLTSLGNLQKGQGDHDDAIASFTNALVIRETLTDTLDIAESLNDIGMIHNRRGNYDEALSFFMRSLHLREAIGDKHRIAIVINNIGIIHGRRGNYEEALSFFSRALALQEEFGNTDGLAHALNNLGLVHRIQGNYDEALDFFKRSLVLREQVGKEEDISGSLNNIGIVYEQRGNFEDALDFYSRALVLQEKMGDKYGIPISLTNIGNSYLNLGAYEKALTAYTRALTIREETGDKAGTSYVLNGIGDIYKNQGAHENALLFFARSLEIKKELGEKLGVANTLSSMAQVYVQQGQLNEALSTSTNALFIADSIKAPLLVRDLHELRSNIFELQERFPEALSEHKAFKATNDSLFTTESQSVMAELQQQYKTKEQQQQIELLKRDQKIKQLWLSGLALGLALIGVIAFLSYNRYRLKNRAHDALATAHTQLQDTHDQLKTTQQQLIHSEKMASLGQMTAGIAHEIKNPLNFVTNFATLNKDCADELSGALTDFPEALLIVTPLLDDIKQNAHFILKHGKRADAIVQSMMQHASRNKSERRMLDLNSLITEYSNVAFHAKRTLMPDLQVDIQMDLDPNLNLVEVSPQDISRVLVNLLDNAFDAVYAKARTLHDAYAPRVCVSTKQVGNNVEICVSDNGIGVPEALLDRVFEPFFTTKPTGAGTGLGLSLSYDIITHGHGGSLVVKNGVGDGARFVVTIPVKHTEVLA